MKSQLNPWGAQWAPSSLAGFKLPYLPVFHDLCNFSPQQLLSARLCGVSPCAHCSGKPQTYVSTCPPWRSHLSVLKLGKCLKAESQTKLEVYSVWFSFLKYHSPMLLDVQGLKTIALYIFKVFITVWSRKVSGTSSSIVTRARLTVLLCDIEQVNSSSVFQFVYLQMKTITGTTLFILLILNLQWPTHYVSCRKHSTYVHYLTVFIHSFKKCY